MMPLTKARLAATPMPPLVVRALRNPLLRNGHLLTLSSGLSGLIGLGYWAVVAWKYGPPVVGRNYAAISMMMFLAALAQLDLSSAMIRFVPSAGRYTMRFVAGAYVVSGSLAVAVSSCFVALAGQLAPGIAFLHDPLLAGTFVCATTAYTIFALQDSVLTGLRRTVWVPLENALFAGAKVALVVLLAAVLPEFGILASWTLSLIGAVVVTSVFLFRRAIPAHQRRNTDHSTLPPLREIVSFVAVDYVGAVCSIAAMTMLPILVISAVGPEQSAYFSLAWVIAFSLHLLNVNMGSSLVVETAIDQSQLARSCREVLSHTVTLLVPSVLLLLVLAPYVLEIFGQPYLAATGLLQVLALAALPHLLVTTAVNSARAQRRMAMVAQIQGSICALTLTLSWVLLHAMGLIGVGLAWLLAQSLVAGVLLIRNDLWLNIGDVAATAASRGARSQRLRWNVWAFCVRAAMFAGVHRWLDGPRQRASERRANSELASLLPDLRPMMSGLTDWVDPSITITVAPIPTVTDLAVAVLAPEDEPAVAVLKIARTPLAALELAAQHDALAVLHADSRLGDWRELLPRVIDFRDRESDSLTVETFLPNPNLATLLSCQPGDLDRLMPGVLGSIAQLYRRTGHPEVVECSHLRRWVDEPLASLRAVCDAITPHLSGTVDRLGEALRGSLADRRVQVSWTHGDFTPGNVLLAAESGEVSGIVDWGGARPGQLAVLDKYLMVLTASCQADGHELGAIVVQRLRAGGLPADQRQMVRQVDVGPPDKPRCDELDEPAMVLLTWLHHVAELQRKCTLYHEHRVWWALNGEPVLRAFTQTAGTQIAPAGRPHQDNEHDNVKHDNVKHDSIERDDSEHSAGRTR